MPFWDQWDGEGLKLYRPWLDNSLTWHAVLAPHNEHRMALTRLADLALVAVIGRWDTWWQLLLNAGLHAMTAALVVGAVWPAFTAAARPLFAVAIGVLFALPTDWQNALWGFQSAFYFAPLLAVIAAAGMANARLGSVRWWLGGGAAALALFSHAGGILVAAAVFGSLALALVLHAPAAKIWPTLVFTACVLLAGIWLHAPQAQHTIARAQTIAQFLGAFTRCLAWPYVDRGSWALLLQLPLLVLIFADWRAQRKPDAAMQFAMALGLFAVLQAAAVAYSRAGTLPELRPLSRYYNPFFLGVAAQIFALCKLAERYGRAARLGLLG